MYISIYIYSRIDSNNNDIHILDALDILISENENTNSSIKEQISRKINFVKAVFPSYSIIGWYSFLTINIIYSI
jgi:hypothetical protein